MLGSRPMARLKIGFIPIEGGAYYKEALEEVTRAEELGFDSVWMEEHHSVTNHYWPSPLAVLAGFAPRPSPTTGSPGLPPTSSACSRARSASSTTGRRRAGARRSRSGL